MSCHYYASPFKKGIRMIGMVIGGIIVAIVFGFAFGFFVQWLWNWLMPSIFGLGKITYWQAFGLVILARLLFGAGHPHYEKTHDKHWHKRYHHEWRHSWGEDWEDHEGWKKWKYYDEWWKNEGKAAFKDYISRQNEPESPKPEN